MALFEEAVPRGLELAKDPPLRLGVTLPGGEVDGDEMIRGPHEGDPIGIGLSVGQFDECRRQRLGLLTDLIEAE